MHKYKWPVLGILSLFLFSLAMYKLGHTPLNTPCLKNSSSICDKTHKLNPKAISYFEKQWSEKMILKQINKGLGKDKSRNHWSIGANLRSYLEFFEVTREPKYLDFVAKAGQRIIELRDDKIKLKDELRNKNNFPGWGSRLSKNAYKRTVSLDQSFALLYPLAMFTRIVGTNPKLKKKYNETLKLFTQEIVVSLNAMDSNWNFNKGFYTAGKPTINVACKKVKKKISKSLYKKCLKHQKTAQKSKALPYHIQSMAGLVFLELNSYLQFEYYLERLKKISSHLNKNFKKEMIQDKKRTHSRWSVEYIVKYKHFKTLFKELGGDQFFSKDQLIISASLFKNDFLQKRRIASLNKSASQMRATDSWLLLAQNDESLCEEFSRVIKKEAHVTSLNFTRMIGQCGDFDMNFSWVN